jgi:cytochrome P450
MGEISSLYPPNTHYQILFTTIARRYNLPAIWYLDLWPLADSFVIVTDPSLMRQATALPKHGIVDNFLSSMVGRNTIVAADGPLWKKLHSIMEPAFSWSFIRSLLDLMAQETSHFLKALDGFAGSGEIFSMVNLTTNLVYDITGRIVFNQELHAQTGGSLTAGDIHQILRLSEASMTWNPFRRAVIMFRKRAVIRRVDDLIKLKIAEQWELLKSRKAAPSRKETSSILDLMLREHMLQSKSLTDREALPLEESQLLVAK